MAAPSISERIKAARKVQREHRDVEVILDQTVSAEVESVEEQIEQLEQEIVAQEAELERITPDLRFSDPRPATIGAAVAALREQIQQLDEQLDGLREGTLLRLRFEQMDGSQWAAIAAKYPQRMESAIDRLSGYNYQATAREAAPLCGYALGDDDEREDLTAEDWDGLFAVISGRETELIASSLWDMNDFGPRRRIDRARKASTDGSASTSSSPSSSESPSADSADGSQPSPSEPSTRKAQTSSTGSSRNRSSTTTTST